MQGKEEALLVVWNCYF